MGLKVGDTYFNRDGYVGIVKERDPKNGSLVVEREGEAFEKTRAIGYINGLQPEERQEFQRIVSTMREKKDALERVNWLQGQIETMQEDPKKHVLTRYLESEMSHVMNSAGINPRSYRIDETKV